MIKVDQKVNQKAKKVIKVIWVGYINIDEDSDDYVKEPGIDNTS